MCNSSVQIDNSTSIFNESPEWFMYCLCQGHFGIHIIIIIKAFSLVLGIPIYCWSLWLFLNGNVKPNLVFSLNVTIVELVFCIESFVELIDTNYLSVAIYKLSLFLIGLFWTVRPLLQICMCIEHYLAVIHPVIFLRYKGIQRRIALAAAAWLIGVGNGLRLVFTGINFFPDHIFFLVFWIAVIIISFCCASVLRALKRPGPGNHKNVEMTEKNRHNKTDRGRAVENQQKRKAFRIISHIFVSILICYLPQVITYFTLIADISNETYLCKVFPLNLSIAVITIIMSPLFRMYSEGHLKHIMCLSKLRGQIKSK